MVYGKPYLPSKRVDGIVPISRGKITVKRLPKAQNDLWLRVIFVLALFGLLLGIWLIANPVAKAKTIELRDCMTNKCICDILLSGDWQGHVQDKSIISGCSPEK